MQINVVLYTPRSKSKNRRNIPQQQTNPSQQLIPRRSSKIREQAPYILFEFSRRCQVLGWPRGSEERNFHAEAANRLDAGQLRPCRTADSIFPPPVPRLERIIIGGTRTQEPSREREREKGGCDCIPMLGRRLDSSSYTELSTPCRRSHGAPLPYDFHVSASGPPKLHDQALYLT